MFVIKRNQVIVTALVVMIAVAGYLNLADNRNTNLEDVAILDEGDIAGVLVSNDGLEDAGVEIVDGEIYVMDDNVEIAMSDEAIMVEGQSDDEPGTAIFVNSSTGNSYFVQAKLDREQSRSKQTETLTSMINNQNIAEEKKAECADAILDLQKRIDKETAAEAMIEAKGFSDAYVRINDDNVDVVVNKEALSEAEIAQIEDIVTRKTGMSADQIRISPLKKQ